MYEIYCYIIYTYIYIYIHIHISQLDIDSFEGLWGTACRRSGPIQVRSQCWICATLVCFWNRVPYGPVSTRASAVILLACLMKPVGTWHVQRAVPQRFSFEPQHFQLAPETNSLYAGGTSLWLSFRSVEDSAGSVCTIPCSESRFDADLGACGAGVLGSSEHSLDHCRGFSNYPYS